MFYLKNQMLKKSHTKKIYREIDNPYLIWCLIHP